jgi:hypothetical protein
VEDRVMNSRLSSEQSAASGVRLNMQHFGWKSFLCSHAHDFGYLGLSELFPDTCTFDIKISTQISHIFIAHH